MSGPPAFQYYVARRYYVARATKPLLALRRAHPYLLREVWNELAEGPARSFYGAEEYFSRMRRAEIGHRHHIAGAYLVRYAQEAAWREDHRRLENRRQISAVAGRAMACRPSVDWSHYWQGKNRVA